MRWGRFYIEPSVSWEIWTQRMSEIQNAPGWLIVACALPPGHPEPCARGCVRESEPLCERVVLN